MKESQWLDNQSAKYGLSTGFIYGLLQLATMAEEARTNPQSALWRSWITYRTFRWMNDNCPAQQGEEPEQHRSRVRNESTQLLGKLAENLQQHGSQYHIPLSTYLYTYRD